MQYESRAGGIGVARGAIVLLIFGRYIKPTPISDNRTYFCNIEILVDPKYISFFTHISV